MKCCGEDRGGRFCPECGKTMAPGSIANLLKHIEVQVAKTKKDLDMMGDSANARLTNKSHDQVKRKFKKWSSWKKELTRLVELDNKIKESEGQA